MKKCDYCKANIDDTATYCPYCGSKTVVSYEEVKEEQAEKQKYDSCAKIANVASKIGICLFFLFGVFCGVISIVLGSMGKKSENQELQIKAAKAVKRGITSVILQGAMYIITMIVIMVISFVLTFSQM